MLVGDRLLMIPGSNTTTTTAAASSSGAATAALTGNSARAMERPTQDAGPLKCPRCDSSNTKFCYYNNYSLSQPRHFCKACKRYWTRGGTLRSVPVGGGCRKNKRVKKPSAAASTPSSDAPSLGPPPPRQPLSLPIPSQIDVSPMFYPLPSDMRDLNFPAIRGRMDPPSSFTCSLQNGNLYDLQPQLSGLGLGFSPNHHYSGDEYHSGFGASLSPLQQSAAVSSAAPLLHDYPLFGPSLPDSSLKQPKKLGLGDYRGLLPYEEDLEGMVKQVKMEGEYNAAVAGSSHRIEWQLPCENPSQSMTTAAAAADSSFLYWNAAMGGAGWPDTSYESSVAPLI